MSSKHQSSRGDSVRGKHPSSKDPKHRKHSSSKSQGSTSGGSTSGIRSFLFVVNEITLNPDVDQPPEVDSWLNELPPSTAAAYGTEYRGQVFQYDNGRVTAAPDYSWVRPQPGFPGGIMHNSSNVYMLPYKTGTIFACSPHLPIILSEGDASCGSSAVFRNCACDNTPFGNDPYRWRLLSFARLGHNNGVSYVNAEARGSPYVAGTNPTWMPALVPSVFANLSGGDVPQSQGLAGDLPTIIGLMAFHGRRGRASDVFSGGEWQQNQWRGRTRAHYPNTEHSTPQGFVVHVAMNVVDGGLSEEEQEDIRAAFEHFEWNTIFVRG